MQEGRIVAEGSHEELASRPGWYADIAARQLPVAGITAAA